jgi:hypothetical protein
MVSKVYRNIIALTILMVVTGCRSNLSKSTFSTTPGVLLTSVTMPLMTDFEHTKVTKTFGQASSMYISFLIADFSIDDPSIKAAARNGNLSKVYYADLKTVTFLSFIGTRTVRAYGVRRAKRKNIHKITSKK